MFGITELKERVKLLEYENDRLIDRLERLEELQEGLPKMEYYDDTTPYMYNRVETFQSLRRKYRGKTKTTYRL